MSALLPGWTQATLGDVARPKTERVVPSAQDNRLYVGLEHIHPNSTKISGQSMAAMMRSSALKFDKGDVLYARLRPYLNKICSPQFSGLASSEFIVLDSQPGLAPRFLLYRLHSPDFVRFTSLFSTGDRPRVKWDQIKAFNISVPPLAEQRRIVEAIEEQFSRLDAAETSLQLAGKKIGQLRASVTYHNIPWTAKEGQLSSILAPGRRISYGVLQPGPDFHTGVPLVRVTDIDGSKVRIEFLKRIEPDIAARYPRTVIRGGEVLLTIVGSIGRAAVAPDSLRGANVARAVAVLPVGQDISSSYVCAVLNTKRVRALLGSLAHEVARKTLNLEDVRRLRIPIPPLNVQEQVVSRISSQLSVCDVIFQTTQLVLERLTTLRRSILERAFTGRLVEQDPNDEPASALLERIAAQKDAVPNAKRSRRLDAGRLLHA